MKIRLYFTLLMVIAIGAVVQAQQGFGGGRHGNPGPNPKQMNQQIVKFLSLTEAQQEELKKINQPFFERMQGVRKEGSAEGMKQLREEHHAAILSILTPEQKTKFEEHKPMGPGFKGGGKHPFNKEFAEKRKAMMEEILQYRKDNIHPVIASQRAKLEKKINATDKKDIDELREKLADLRKEGMGKGPNGGFGFGRKGGGMHMGHKGPGICLMNDAAHEQAEKLVKKYGKDIETLMNEIAAKREQWHSDIKDIFEKYRPEVNFQHKDSKGKEASKELEARRDFHRKLHFLLMKADAPIGDAVKPQNQRSINVYPNPAGATQFIEFEMVNQGIVKVEIVDQGGNVMKSVFKGELPKGMNKLEVNVGELRGNMYYYRITDAAGVTSKPFIR
jgi:DNA-binding MarR family transcriptional regulator